MKYLLFEKSSIETFVSKSNLQSIDFVSGHDFVNTICGDLRPQLIENTLITYTDDGIIFTGKACLKTFFLIDLTQCQLIEFEKASPENILLVLQKSFRTAIRTWETQPFTASERINGTKSIVFPYTYTDHRRIVIERSPECRRLIKRGVEKPLLAYKYNAEDAPRGEEKADTSVLEKAGEDYLERLPHIIQYYNTQRKNGLRSEEDINILQLETASQQVSNGGFMYLPYDQQLSKLSISQRNVVENSNVTMPIRIDGPAGTGKTASMILRAYRLLLKAEEKGEPYSIAFFTHSESTKIEVEHAFSMLKNADKFISQELPQRIHISTLFKYCIMSAGINESQVIDQDAADAKQTQRLFIEEALETILKSKYNTYKPILSPALREAFDATLTSRGALLSMLQHEFSIQIKGRTDGTIEKYYELPTIKNALPVESNKDKEFVFLIYQKYQKMLESSSVYDIDDITMQALAQWNAPIWRRERNEKGFNYIFVDEMHLFNRNEQYAFHHLSQNAKMVPICFALDYGQAIGDRGDISNDFIENEFEKAQKNKYTTIFRSSPQILDFCKSIAASGTLMFEDQYRDSYGAASSIFTNDEENKCHVPCLYMYNDDVEMINSIKKHVESCQKDLQCKNHEIAIISFADALFDSENVKMLSDMLGKSILVLKDRYSFPSEKSSKDSSIILADPYSINGLEYQGVILVGVDEGRVPQKVGVSDISINYIKYVAFTQLYLASSRAKYKLTLLGNNLHGVSSCLQFALDHKTLKQVE